MYTPSVKPYVNMQLNVSHISIQYQDHVVVDDVSFQLPPASLAAIVGPNGAGKSSLLKGILGIHPIKKGNVYFNGQTLSSVRPHIAYVPQRESVDWDFPATVLDVVLMGRYPHLNWWKRYRSIDYNKARKSLEQVNLIDLADRQIAQLSGGQQQRVFLARALAQEASIYFMDEPFAGVDAATEKNIVSVLKELQAGGKSIMVVHHDLQTIRSYFSSILLLNKKVIAFGPTDEVFTPERIQQTYQRESLLL